MLSLGLTYRWLGTWRYNYLVEVKSEIKNSFSSAILIWTCLDVVSSTSNGVNSMGGGAADVVVKEQKNILGPKLIIAHFDLD